ncbi:RES domain-containing protein [Lactococcus carnosus]|uniref:RES domain-containing protein n=1 Tax=Pseudolactococcus carnosus TaxID=2749961 RepID=UPI000812008B|nr:RES domain-containing protein [Lactococcus carnosus]MCJ1968719.1 RES domain-containing protein [Lactococcus carnosus]SCA91767.1 hypothetical protein LP2241_20538 [Lactococcus piscium]
MTYKVKSVCKEIIERTLYMENRKFSGVSVEESLNLAREANLKSGQVLEINNENYNGKIIRFDLPSSDNISIEIEKQILEVDNIFDNFSSETSYEDISNLFNKILTYQFPIPKEFSTSDYPVGISELGFLPLPNTEELKGCISSGGIVFRIRENSMSIKENLSDYSIQSFWNAPDEFVGIGRLNKANDSILYIADTPRTAIKEVKFQSGDMGYLNFYITKEDVNLASIESANNSINNIMVKLFSEKISIPENYKYKLTQEIAERYYNYKNVNLDGWMYPSIASDNKAKCAAIDKNKINKLEFIGSARIKIIDDDYASIDHVVIPMNDDKLFYCELGQDFELTNKWLIDDYDLLGNFICKFPRDIDAIKIKDQ